MLGSPLFPGESGIDQLVEIIKVLGTPTREQIKTMNPNVYLFVPSLSIISLYFAVYGTQIPPNKAASLH